MFKTLVKLTAVVGVGCAVWFLVMEMQTKFFILGYVKTGLGLSRMVGAQDHLTVRFDYDVKSPEEAVRAKKLVDYFKAAMPDKDLWYALVVDRLGNTYQVFFPIKQGIENDFVMMLQMRALVNDISAKVFDGGSVDLHLCDMNFNTVRVVPAQ